MAQPNVYQQSFQMGQSVGGPGGLLGFMAQRRRDAIANQLLQENGYPGTGGEVELSLRNRMEQMRAQAAQRQMMADYRAAETARMQRQADGTDAQNKAANSIMASTPGMEGNTGGGAGELQLRMKMQQAQAQREAAQQKLQQQAEIAKQRALAGHLQFTPEERASAKENAQQIEALNKEIDGLRGQLVPTGLPIDQILGSDEVAGLSSGGIPNTDPATKGQQPMLVPPGGASDAGDTLMFRKGAQQQTLKPSFAPDTSNPKAIQSMGQFLGMVRSLQDKQTQLQKVKAAQAAPFASKIADLAASGDNDAAQAKSAIARGADPMAVYQRLIQHKQAQGFNPAPAAGEQPAASPDPGAASSFGVPLGYSPESAAAGLDPEDDLAAQPDDETAAASAA